MSSTSFLLRLLPILPLAFLSCGQAADNPLPPGTKTYRDLAYVTNPHPKQKLDLYVPATPKGPLLVVIHGGGWRAGSKDKAEGLELLPFGYVVANLDYRLTQDATFPAQVEDCKAAIRWLRAHAADYGYDPKRVGAWGASAGGHLVALLAVTGSMRDFDVGEHLDQSSAIQCGVDCFGPTDLPGWKPASANPMIQRTGPESILSELLAPVDEKVDLARRASPVTWVDKTAAPLFILHGSADPLVGVEQSQELADKLKAVGAEVTFEIVAGGGHGSGPFFAEGRPQRLLEFLNKHLAQP